MVKERFFFFFLMMHSSANKENKSALKSKEVVMYQIGPEDSRQNFQTSQWTSVTMPPNTTLKEKSCFWRTKDTLEYTEKLERMGSVIRQHDRLT